MGAPSKVKKSKKSSNQWVEFLKQNRGAGKTVSELRDMYLEKTTDAPPVYLYNDKADVKVDSLLESLKQDTHVFPQGINHINDKLELKQLDDITAKEEEAWRLAFEMALTDDYTLNKQQLLNSHDWWIQRLVTESDLDSDDVGLITDAIQRTSHKDIYQLLDHILSSFTLEQLYSIGHPDMKE
jgi:hypothetical protein